jgi:hypothetical protein
LSRCGFVGLVILHVVVHREAAPPFPCRHPERWPHCQDCVDRDSCDEYWDGYRLRLEEEEK